jgi:choline dehydrogenase
MAEILHEADFVVVGAGSAGALLAARLAADGKHSVAIVEAGPPGRDPLLSVPLLTGWFLRGDKYTWAFETEPQKQLDGRRLKWPRGKLVGGSGAINGMVWVRGLASDYEHWAQTGLRDWSWEKVEPVYKKLETEPSDDGRKALGIEQPEWWTPLYDAYLSAAETAGYGRTHDFNGPDPMGAGRYRFNIRGGRRASTARAYLKPAAARGALRLITDAEVLRLTFDGMRCTGVILRHGGAERLVKARREVIVCAGTVGSPHLLLRSGVGPAAELATLGVKIVADRKQVGENLQDHLLIRVEHAALKPGGLNELLRADRAAWALLRALIAGKGPAACFPLLVGGYFRSEPGLAEPDLQSHFMPALTSATIRVNPFRDPPGARQENGFFANICQMRPESRGRISLASADPLAAPRIDPNYLSAPRDKRVLTAGVRILRKLFAQPAFDGWRGAELMPGPGVDSDAEIAAWIAQKADTVYHPVGTCRMGTDAESVVDERLAVRGLTGLRVVDASVMPAITSANTNAPTIMIAERAADFILADASA